MKRRLVTAKKQTNKSLKSKKISSSKKAPEKTIVKAASRAAGKAEGSKKSSSVSSKSNAIKSKSSIKSKLLPAITRNAKLLSVKPTINAGVSPVDGNVRDKSRLLAKKVKDTSNKPRGKGLAKARSAAPSKIDADIANNSKALGMNEDAAEVAVAVSSLPADVPLVPMTSEALARSANNPDFQQAMASVNAEVFKVKGNPKPLVFPPPPAEFRPPRSSLSNLVLENRWKELEKKLKSKVNPNTRDETGLTASWTPLYWSVKLCRVECVRLLLSFGADVNMVISDIDECSGTVLDLVSIRGDSAMEAMLREHVRKDEISINQAFRAIRTKLRGRAPAFNFRQYAK